ncbi:MAG: hypothetical protein L0196_03540 [candidate division Zixibacteria bacterium]|nr:hypothetical protein [candidate division Zixibacteria bacterium]
MLLLATVSIILNSSLKHNQRKLIYALDDPYIHMAIAKNFAQDGVWGVTKYQFSNSSSAPLWTLLISLFYFLFGVSEIVPLLLNLITASTLLFSAYYVLEKFQTSNFYKFVVLIAILYFTPLPTLIFSGQEHILHALLTVLFAHLAAKELSGEAAALRGRRAGLMVLAPALASIRYEGLFLAALVSLFFLFRKRRLFSILLGALALAPPIVYGLISLSKGWFFFPNPILVKSILLMLPGEKNVFSLLGYLVTGAYQLFFAIRHFTFLFISALLVYAWRGWEKKKFWNQNQILLLFFIGSTLLHILFANAGWFFRYEAYLIAFGLFAISAAIFESLSDPGPEIQTQKKPVLRYAIIFLSLLLISPLVRRGFLALQQTRTATTNIYEQQYQMGLFAKEFYSERPVAANDIGVICFLSNARCFDLWGLGNKETAILRISGYYGPEEIDALTFPMEAVIVYEESFVDVMPARWIKTGQWKISDNIVAAYDSVAFFAPDSAKAARLMENLKAFALRLPKTVVQSGKYLDYIGE